MSGRPGTNDAFDRAAKGRARGHARDGGGKEALFSTAPTSAPPPPVDVHCPICEVTTGLVSVADWLALMVPPFLFNPLGPSVWARCPHCRRRGWLALGLGQGIRALLGRPTA